jgi:hypothetical protein
MSAMTRSRSKGGCDLLLARPELDLLRQRRFGWPPHADRTRRRLNSGRSPPGERRSRGGGGLLRARSPARLHPGACQSLGSRIGRRREGGPLDSTTQFGGNLQHRTQEKQKKKLMSRHDHHLSEIALVLGLDSCTAYGCIAALCLALSGVDGWAGLDAAPVHLPRALQGCARGIVAAVVL